MFCNTVTSSIFSKISIPLNFSRIFFTISRNFAKFLQKTFKFLYSISSCRQVQLHSWSVSRSLPNFSASFHSRIPNSTSAFACPRSRSPRRLFSASCWLQCSCSLALDRRKFAAYRDRIGNIDSPGWTCTCRRELFHGWSPSSPSWSLRLKCLGGFLAGRFDDSRVSRECSCTDRAQPPLLARRLKYQCTDRCSQHFGSLKDQENLIFVEIRKKFNSLHQTQKKEDQQQDIDPACPM